MAYSWANYPYTTEQFGNAIFDHMEVLRRFPYVGTPVTGRPGERVLVHTPILIYYRVRESAQAVDILRVRHASRRR